MSISCAGYKFSRRAVLGASSGLFLGMPVRNLLAAAGKDHAAKAEHVILFWNGGGMTHLDTWDPKPGRETQGEFEPIHTSAPGVMISEIFPQVARQAHNMAFVRSIAGINGDHGRATYQLQTSYGQTPNIMHPGIGSVVVHEKEKLGDLPAYISIGGGAPRATYLGQRCEAYFIGEPGQKDPYLAFPQGIAEVRGNKRLELLEKYNRQFRDQGDSPQLVSNETSVKEAVALMRSPALEALELTGIDSDTLSRYGNTAFGRGCLLAKRLVEKGVRFVQVNRGGFDTHSDNFDAMRNHGEVMDGALASMLQDLSETGMLDKTLVLMLSEFGRTPKINGNAGRDHWAAVFSCFFAGGGVKGGQVIGSSDADGYQPHDRPVNPQDLHASVCHAMGIDPNKEVMTPLSRPFKLVDKGVPVQELFS